MREGGLFAPHYASVPKEKGRPLCASVLPLLNPKVLSRLLTSFSLGWEAGRGYSSLFLLRMGSWKRLFLRPFSLGWEAGRGSLPYPPWYMLVGVPTLVYALLPYPVGVHPAVHVQYLRCTVCTTRSDNTGMCTTLTFINGKRPQPLGRLPFSLRNKPPYLEETAHNGQETRYRESPRTRRTRK